MPDPEIILVLVRDLLFSSKINATARAQNTPVKMIRDAAALGVQPGRSLIVDLNQDGALDAAAAWRKSGGRPVIGFVSHTDAATVARAREAGVDRVVARSQFVQILPDLLAQAPPKQ